MMVAPIQTEPTFKAGKPRVLFEGLSSLGYNNYFGYDISPDGQHFLMIKQEEDEETAQLNVVLNWFEELKRRVPTSK